MQEILREILEKIKEYDTVMIFRHFRPDGDAIGATKGLARILSLTYPDKKIMLQNADHSSKLAFLGKEDAIADDETYRDALGIVVDTATRERVSNKKFTLCREIIKIDHHIPVDSFGTIEWVDEKRSSACEMIAEFYEAMKDELKIDSQAATYVYCGMVTDSGRFLYKGVSGDTMRLAGAMLDLGIDTDTLFANLYLRDFDSYKFEVYARRRIKITENGVAYLFVDKRMQKKFALSGEDASASVAFMDSIKGSLIWVTFIESDNGVIRARLRSRFVTVNDIAERYEGGGHACAAGATVHSKNQLKALVREADQKLGEYKKAHPEAI